MTQLQYPRLGSNHAERLGPHGRLCRLSHCGSARKFLLLADGDSIRKASHAVTLD